MIVQRIRGTIIRTVLCCIMYNSCAEWYAHTWTVLKVDCRFRFRFRLDLGLLFGAVCSCCLLLLC